MKYIFSTTFKLTISILPFLFSATVVAHSGHSEASDVSHSLDHLLWISAGVGLVAYLSYCIIKKI
jgi:ABC-type iron transport system FetAB permease component